MNRRQIDIVIVNYLTGELTRQSVAALQAPGFRLLVADNSGELLRDPPAGCELIGDGTNLLYAAASNRAYARGNAPHVLLLNPDVTISVAQVQKLSDELTAHPEAWSVAPALVAPDPTAHNYLRRLPTTRGLLAHFVWPLRPFLRTAYRRYYCLDVDADQSGALEQPAAACLMLRRDRVGAPLFDERYGLFFNDTDLSRRMLAQGWICWYDATNRVSHVGGLSIQRERQRSGTWVSDEFDRAALTYARQNLSGSTLLAAAIALRRWLRAWRNRHAPEPARG